MTEAAWDLKIALTENSRPQFNVATCKRTVFSSLLIGHRRPKLTLRVCYVNYLLIRESVSRYKRPLRLSKINYWGPRTLNIIIFTFFYIKINNGDRLTFDVLLSFLVWIHRFSRCFGCYCVTPVTQSEEKKWYLAFADLSILFLIQRLNTRIHQR